VQCEQVKTYLEYYGVEVGYISSEDYVFSTMHNKGVIVDNTSVLVSSINWNEHSVMRNREVGIIISNESVAQYYAQVFFYDWDISQGNIKPYNAMSFSWGENTIYIVILFTMTFIIIIRDWRKREWSS
jgi:phosphatidylserine/phosphatidylglycerophosphate/cardiolipin synthase-like enzyme